MPGKAYAVVEINNNPYPTVTQVSGFETHPKTREVPDPETAGAMIEEPVGEERVPGEMVFFERAKEGFRLDQLLEEMLAWQNEEDDKKRFKGVSIVFYHDKKFKKALSRLEVFDAWPKEVSNFEVDHSSEEARSFKVVMTHRGSKFKRL